MAEATEMGFDDRSMHRRGENRRPLVRPTRKSCLGHHTHSSGGGSDMTRSKSKKRVARHESSWGRAFMPKSLVRPSYPDDPRLALGRLIPSLLTPIGSIRS